MGEQALISGIHIVRKKNASGWTWYVYAWRGGPQVFRSEGRKRPNLPPLVLRTVAAALETRSPALEKNLRALIREWRSQDCERPSSSEWERLAASTKKTWGSALDAIERKWGDVPLPVFNDPRMKARVVSWRDTRAHTPRAADIGITVLHALLKFGMLRGKVFINVAAGIPALYQAGTRAEIIWTDDEISRFCAHARRSDRTAAADALLLAVNTGLRREDLVTLTSAQVSEFAILKEAKKRTRGRRHFARVVRLPELDAVLTDLESRVRAPGVQTVLVDDRGASWTPDRLTRAIGAIRDELNIVHVDEETGKRRKKHLHDARGTFATKLIGTGRYSDMEVAEMMGWSPHQVSRIRYMYVDRSATIVALGRRIGQDV